MARDVLIVDDIKSALENFGIEVSLNLGIEPFLTDNPQQALDILRYYHIKVLVTDQEMPNMTGTELVRKVKKELGLKIPCILLTGYVDKVSVVDAVNLGFFRFIDKLNTHAELTQAIRQAIQQYEMDILPKYTIYIDKLLTKKKSFFKINPNTSLRLMRVSSIIDPFVRDDDWKTELIAQRGLCGKREISICRRTSATYECGIDTQLLYKTGFKLGDIISSLESSLEGKIILTAKGKYEHEIEIKSNDTIEVKEITDNPTQEGLILQSREYQMAPVYTRINCLFRIDCNCCNIPKNFDLSVDLPTNRIALRQVEHFDKGQTKKLYTGFVIGSISYL